MSNDEDEELSAEELEELELRELRQAKREAALYKHAQLVYDFDRDFPGEFSDEG